MEPCSFLMKGGRDEREQCNCNVREALFKTIGKIVKKKVELVGNFVSVLQAVKCQIPLVVMMGSKDEAFDIERSLNAMLGAHQNFKSMPEIKLLKSYSKSPNISAGDCVTTSFIHFTNEESEFFQFCGRAFEYAAFSGELPPVLFAESERG